MPSWAVVLCKFRDNPADTVSADFCKTFFSPGSGGLYDYWRDVSFGKIALDGTTLFGPITLSYTADEARAKQAAAVAALKAKGIDDNGRNTLLQLAADDISRKLNLSAYTGLIVIYNAQLDAGAGGATLTLPDGTKRGVPAMNLDNLSFDPGLFGHLLEHESGHMLGLPHSFLFEPRTEYGDGWDVMGGLRADGSGADCRFKSPSAALNHVRSGPGLSAPNLRRLGCLEPARVVTYPDHGARRTVTLAPVNHAEAPGALMAEVELPQDGYSALTVELRWNDQWDRGIPRPAFLLHLVDEGGTLFLLPQSPTQHDWLPGQQYVSPDTRLTIDFEAIDSVKRIGTIGIRRALWHFPLPHVPVRPRRRLPPR